MFILFSVCGDLKVLDLLIQNGADMESKDTHHAYPIHYAAQMNSQNSGKSDPKISEKVLKKVLDCKVSLSVVDDTGRQPLLWAACSGVITFLVEGLTLSRTTKVTLFQIERVCRRKFGIC